MTDSITFKVTLADAVYELAKVQHHRLTSSEVDALIRQGKVWLDGKIHYETKTAVKPSSTVAVDW